MPAPQLRSAYGSRNATMVSCAVTTTYCYPSLPRYVIGFAYAFAGSFVSHSSFPVLDSYAWKRWSSVAPMNSSPLAVATEPPMLYDPVFITPIFSSDSTRPNGTLHTTSPVFALMANSSPQGGAWHGHPVAGFVIAPTFLRTYGIWLASPAPLIFPVGRAFAGTCATIFCTPPRSCELMK